MQYTRILAPVFALFLFAVGTVGAEETMHGYDHSEHATMDHSKMDHGTMHHKMEEASTTATGVGVIHSVSKLNRMVNLTHEPIPALKWSEMTMDLPVEKSVDLHAFQAGDKVTFTLKLDADKKYIITSIEK